VARLPALLMAGSMPTVQLPTETWRLLPSLSTLIDENVAHRREMFLALATRVDAAVTEIRALDVPTDLTEVVTFLTMIAERRGMALPVPTLLALDIQAISQSIPADLFPIACFRIWTRFAYRRLPEPSDFLTAVKEELDERREAAAKVAVATHKIAHARWLEQKDAEARERHAAAKKVEHEQMRIALERLRRQTEEAEKAARAGGQEPESTADVPPGAHAPEAEASTVQTPNAGTHRSGEAREVAAQAVTAGCTATGNQAVQSGMASSSTPPFRGWAWSRPSDASWAFSSAPPRRAWPPRVPAPLGENIKFRRARSGRGGRSRDLGIVGNYGWVPSGEQVTQAAIEDLSAGLQEQRGTFLRLLHLQLSGALAHGCRGCPNG
jgi:hypothetical protein